MTKLEIEIEKGRLETQRIRQEIRADSRKFMAQAGITVAACVSAGVAVGAYFAPSYLPRLPQPPQVIIIQAPAGTTATVLSPGARAPVAPVPTAK